MLQQSFLPDLRFQIHALRDQWLSSLARSLRVDDTKWKSSICKVALPAMIDPIRVHSPDTSSGSSSAAPATLLHRRVEPSYSSSAFRHMPVTCVVYWSRLVSVPNLFPRVAVSDSLLRFAAALRASTTLDSLRLGALNVMSRDPVFIVRLAGRNSGPFGVGGNSSVNLLRLRLLADLSGLSLLGEVRNNPDRVKEITDAHGAGQEEKVEEEAVTKLAGDQNGLGFWALTAAGRRC